MAPVTGRASPSSGAQHAHKGGTHALSRARKGYREMPCEAGLQVPLEEGGSTGKGIREAGKTDEGTQP